MNYNYTIKYKLLQYVKYIKIPYFQIGFFPKVYVQEHSQYTLKMSNQIRI